MQDEKHKHNLFFIHKNFIGIKTGSHAFMKSGAFMETIKFHCDTVYTYCMWLQIIWLDSCN